MFNTWKPDGSQDPFAGLDVAPPSAAMGAPLGPAMGPVSAALQTIQRNAAAAANAPSGSCSIINEWLTMRGDLESEGDILIKGRVFGNIRCKMLIVDQGAHIEGGVRAEEMVVRGSARGTIKVKRLRVEKSAQVDGEIYQDSFSAEEGARITGALKSNAATQEDELPAAIKAERPMPKQERRGASALYQILDEARASGQTRQATPAPNTHGDH